MYKITGNRRKQVKSNLAKLKSLIKYFWHNEFILEMYGENSSNEFSNRVYHKLKVDATNLEKLLAEEVVED